MSVTWHAQDMSHEAHSRILVVGDLHENTGAGLPSPSTAGALGADLLLQVGVFGFWSPSASRAGTVVDTATMNDSAGSTRFPSEMMAVAASPTTSGTLPRGFGWQCGDTSRSGGGGAVSVDKSFRVKGATWFAEGELTLQEVDRIIARGRSDVLVTQMTPRSACPSSGRSSARPSQRGAENHHGRPGL